GHESREILQNTAHLRLLQHEFGNQDGIGIARVPPGEIARRFSVPRQKLVSKGFLPSRGGRSGHAYTRYTSMRAFTAALDLRRFVGRWTLRSASHAGRFSFMVLDLVRSPVALLLVTRMLAGLIAIAARVMLGNAFGLVVAYITAQASLGLSYADFEFGARYFFRPLDLWYSLIKSFAFAGAVTIIPCYIGFNTQQGAEGVGRATTQAVVAASVTVLMLDTILTKIILGTAK